MSNLDYYGNLTDDIKLIKKYSGKKNNLFMKIDIVYLAILISYLIFVFARCANGLGTIPGLQTFINLMIITRNLIYIKRLNTKNKADSARSRIASLATKIFEEKNQANNLSGRLYSSDFEEAIIIEEHESTKKYDENNVVYDYIDTVVNYIYLLDSEDTITVLKEIKDTIKDENNEKNVETYLELLSVNELPDELPVKRVLKLAKDND